MRSIPPFTHLALAACSATPQAGPEVVFAFVAPSSDPYTVELTNPTADLALYVLSGSTDCSAATCTGFSEGTGDRSVTFNTIVGETYFLVVEDAAVAGATFNLAMAPCPEAPMFADGIESGGTSLWSAAVP